MSIETLDLGRDAYARHAWAEATEALSDADHDQGLSAEDLESLGEAAWWNGDPETAIDALERAFAAHQAAGRKAAAASIALLLTYLAFRRLAFPIGAGWLARAERLLEDEPESGVHAWLEIVRAAGAVGAGRLAEATDHVERALELGRRHEERDAHALALSFSGALAIARGQWRDGLAHIDEAAAAASSGQLRLRTASDIYCNTIAACRDIADFRRAGQWIEEADRFMRRQAVGGYPGICRVHHAELDMLRGRWPEAEREARHATTELTLFRIMDGVGFAHYEIGEVRLRMGDLAAAAEAFDLAYEHGHDALPGLAILQLLRGDSDEAARTIERGLAQSQATAGAVDLARRARLLPASVEIALARGDLEAAGLAVDELESIAERVEQPVFQASALHARGALLLQSGDGPGAAAVLDRAWRAWRDLDLPYESGRARMLYGQALAATGDAAAARRDLRAARASFERLGATLDVRAVDALSGEPAGPAEAGERVQRTFMFTDIVTSTDLIGLIGDASWEDLLRWHDRELKAAFAANGGEPVNHTGDGFFVAFERADDGLTCAIDIQRRLARHRREHGFAPQVRIGLHTAEATHHGADYTGRGVHVAARVGAAAGGEEILATSAVVSAVTAVSAGPSRALKLKGIQEAIEVHAIEWR